MNDLTTRLLAEIERREKANTYRYWHGESTGAQEALAYLAALRKVATLHVKSEFEPNACDVCDHCFGGGQWPCETAREVAAALGVDVG